MPDWSYQPLFRPLLMRLPPEVARDVTLGVIGALARLPGGTAVIALLGHMDPPDGIAASLCGIPLRSPVGLAAGVDPHLFATSALARFGFGFIEVGPVTRQPLRSSTPLACDQTAREIAVSDSPWSDGLEAVEKRLARLGQPRVPLLMRLALTPRLPHMRQGPHAEPAAELAELACRLRPRASAFVVEVGTSPAEAVAGLRHAAPDRPVLIRAPP